MRKEQRPDYARGQDDAVGEETRDPRRFSEGQENESPTHEKEHEGTFSEGQARKEPHPEGTLHGRFSRGQEETPPEAPQD